MDAKVCRSGIFIHILYHYQWSSLGSGLELTANQLSWDVMGSFLGSEKEMGGIQVLRVDGHRSDLGVVDSATLHIKIVD